MKRSKPDGYWTNFQNLKRELKDFNQTSGRKQLMPSRRQLEVAGRLDIFWGISLHGGFIAVAQRLGWKWVSGSKPSYAWVASHLKQELLAWIAQHGVPGQMPTYPQLTALGRPDLVWAIWKNGGSPLVAKRLRLRHSREAKRLTLAEVKAALTAFRQMHHLGPRMPKQDELRAARRLDLVHAISQQGGFPAVAKRLGLRHIWGNRFTLSEMKTEITAFRKAHRLGRYLPTEKELLTARRPDLVRDIERRGGSRAVAQKLQLKVRPTGRRPAREK